MSQTVNMTAVQALETVAVACAITAARLGNAEGLAFWQGQFNAAQSLKNGTAAACAKRIALSGYPVQREVEGAFACLSNDPKGLTSARVHEVLMAYGIDSPGHNITQSQLERRWVPEHGGEAVVSNTHGEQATSGVDGNDGSGVHGASDAQTAIVATAEGGAA
jgi:hypothetical protein